MQADSSVEKIDALRDQTRQRLSELFERHDRAYLSFSGGKDSVVLADLCRPWIDRITLVWVNTGIMWPHMVEFVRSYLDEWDLIELASNPTRDWQTYGTPADLVPVQNMYVTSKEHVQPWVDCCMRNRSVPIYEFVNSQPKGAFLHGQRLSDDVRATDAIKQTIMPNHEVWGPLAKWTDKDVWAYIDAERLKLPEQYPAVRESLECALCPADQSVAKLRYLQAKSPPTAARIRAAMTAQISLARCEIERLNMILKEVSE